MILPVFTINSYENVILSFIFYVLCDNFNYMLRIRNKLNGIQMP